MRKSEFIEVQGGEEVVAKYDFRRFGKHGPIRGSFSVTRDKVTGELTFHAKVGDLARHLEEDFDVIILVLAWGLWASADRAGCLTDDASIAATTFIGCAIERWLCKQYKLMRAEFGDGDYES